LIRNVLVRQLLLLDDDSNAEADEHNTRNDHRQHEQRQMSQ
jgi:hypothetical protein